MTEEKKTNEQLVKEIQSGKQYLLEILIHRNMGLVKKLVSKMALYNQFSYADEQDLKQVGMIKIMEAAKRFNASQNTLFSTYAVVHIRGGMINWIRENKSFIHIPNEMRKKYTEYKNVVETFGAQNNGRLPSDRYFMKMLSVDADELSVIRDTIKAFKVDSLDKEIEGENNVALVADTIEDKEDKYMELFLEEDKRRMFGLILKLRNGKERKVIIDEYYNNIPQVKIAEIMGVTAQRVQNLKRDALQHLRELPEIVEMAKEYGIKEERPD